MQDYFYTLADRLTSLLHDDEFYTCFWHSEASDFVRFNHSAIRQAGTVDQKNLLLDLSRGRRHATAVLTLAGVMEEDERRLAALLQSLREQIQYLPEDPYFLYATEQCSSVTEGTNQLPARAEAVAALMQAGAGRDLVGIYAAGSIYEGFANASGQRNWFSTHSFHCDWSFYWQNDKAVKTAYAGFVWEPQIFAQKLAEANEQLERLRHPARSVTPGHYRVYLAPAAVVDILELLSWGGFSLKARRTKQTPLLKMVEAGQTLHPQVTLRENTQEGVAPNFQAAGFLKPPQVPLIEAGHLRDSLASPRSSQEYGIPTNGSSSEETPVSLDMAPGHITRHNILKELDTGIYINNVWYLNYSDRTACRMTGMTRFATFWVEHGVLQQPLNVMRFDESLYHFLGDKLLGLTTEREFLLDSSTYFQRSTKSYRVPGLLVQDFTLTL